MIETEVFARLPEELRIRARKSGWLFGMGTARRDSFLEVPSFDRRRP